MLISASYTLPVAWSIPTLLLWLPNWGEITSPLITQTTVLGWRPRGVQEATVCLMTRNGSTGPQFCVSLVLWSSLRCSSFESRWDSNYKKQKGEELQIRVAEGWGNLPPKDWVLRTLLCSQLRDPVLWDKNKKTVLCDCARRPGFLAFGRTWSQLKCWPKTHSPVRGSYLRFKKSANSSK